MCKAMQSVIARHATHACFCGCVPCGIRKHQPQNLPWVLGNWRLVLGAKQFPSTNSQAHKEILVLACFASTNPCVVLAKHALLCTRCFAQCQASLARVQSKGFPKVANSLRALQAPRKGWCLRSTQARVLLHVLCNACNSCLGIAKHTCLLRTQGRNLQFRNLCEFVRSKPLVRIQGQGQFQQKRKEEKEKLSRP